MSVFILLIGLLTIGCPVAESRLYSPEEANTKILAAYASRDAECGTGHVLYLPVLFDANEGDVNNCVAQILATDCATWTRDDPTPAMCMGMQVDL